MLLKLKEEGSSLATKPDPSFRRGECLGSIHIESPSL